MRAHDTQRMPLVRVDDLGAIGDHRTGSLRSERPAGGGAVDQGLLPTPRTGPGPRVRTSVLPPGSARRASLAVGGELGEGRRLETGELDLPQDHARAFVARGGAERGHERPAAGRAQGEQDREGEPRAPCRPSPRRRPGSLVEPELAAATSTRPARRGRRRRCRGPGASGGGRGGLRPSPTGSPSGRPASGRRRIFPSSIRGVGSWGLLTFSTMATSRDRGHAGAAAPGVRVHVGSPGHGRQSAIGDKRPFVTRRPASVVPGYFPPSYLKRACDPGPVGFDLAVLRFMSRVVTSATRRSRRLFAARLTAAAAAFSTTRCWSPPAR